MPLVSPEKGAKKMPNQRAFMSVVNRKYIDPLKIMWTSLFSTNSYPLDFYLFYEDLSDDDTSDLVSFVSRWPDVKLVLMPMDANMFEGLPVTEEFPKEIYFKFAGLDHLPEDLKQIVCMDIDMAVKRDISEIFSKDVSSCGLAACEDVFGHFFGMGNNLARLGLRNDRPYFNAGFMIFSLEFIQKIGGGKAILKLAHLNKKILYFPEQDILNLIFHDSFLLLPWNVYNCPPIHYVMNRERVEAGILEPLELSLIMANEIPEGYLDYTRSVYDNAAIVHYMGRSKPWRAERESSTVYDIFDEAYLRAKDLVK